MDIVHVIGPKVRGFKPADRDGFLRAIKIRSTTSFGVVVSRRPHAVIVYGILKIPAEYDRDTSPAKLRDISRQVPPCFATMCLCWFTAC
jgi:hypothetical protein